MHHIKEFFHSKVFTHILYIVGVALLALVIFAAGVFTGFRKASFSYRWGDKYSHMFGGRDSRYGDQDNFGRMFGSPNRGFGGGMMRGWGDFSNSHGVMGKIVKITLPTMLVADQDGVEKMVMIKDDTVIKSSRDEIKPTDLKETDTVVVIGEPNDQSQVEAKLIRVMPSVFVPGAGNPGTPGWMMAPVPAAAPAPAPAAGNANAQ